MRISSNKKTKFNIFKVKTDLKILKRKLKCVIKQLSVILEMELKLLSNHAAEDL